MNLKVMHNYLFAFLDKKYTFRIKVEELLNTVDQKIIYAQRDKEVFTLKNDLSTISEHLDKV